MPHAAITPVYLYRPNRRRLELTWGEATLLDAARSFGGSDCQPWDHAMECLTDVAPQALAGTCIDKHKVMWAAETERFRPRWPTGEGDNCHRHHTAAGGPPASRANNLTRTDI